MNRRRLKEIRMTFIKAWLEIPWLACSSTLSWGNESELAFNIHKITWHCKWSRAQSQCHELGVPWEQCVYEGTPTICGRCWLLSGGWPGRNPSNRLYNTSSAGRYPRLLFVTHVHIHALSDISLEESCCTCPTKVCLSFRIRRQHS